MYVIGLSGKAETGKDHVFENFLRPLGYQALSLADPVKEIAVGQGRCTYEEAYVTKPPHVRTLLQQIGTEEWRAKYGEDVWCRMLDTRMRRIHARTGQDKFAIPDVRFANEVAFVQGLSGVVFRMFAPDRAAASKLDAEQRQHPSEIALDAWDPVQGDGGLIRPKEDLFDAVLDNRLHLSEQLSGQVYTALRFLDLLDPALEYPGPAPWRDALV